MFLIKIVEESISKPGKDYLTKERSYLTEGDAVCSLFSILRNHTELKEIAIHSQLRPFYGKIDSPFVIGRTKEGRIDWIKQEIANKVRANKGSLVDIAIIDVNEEHWKKAYAKAQKDQNSSTRENLKIGEYSRIPLRPSVL